MNIFKYLITSTACLSIFYAVYMLVLRKDSNFKLMRFYLLASIFLSLLMPLSSFRIDLEIFKNKTQTVSPNFMKLIDENRVNGFFQKSNVKSRNIARSTDSNLTDKAIVQLSNLYILISIVLLARIIFQISIIVFQFYKSKRQKHGKYLIIYNKHFKHTFSFFNWIFIYPDNVQPEDTEQIILHEKIHASQHHSIDLILIEILATVMWFNPFVWSMRRSIQLVHEYLADEGVLDTGIDRLKYQALLINQVTEEKLICVSSNFNSLIKKRMIMITKSKLSQKTKFRIIALVPVSAIVFIAIACINGVFSSRAQASPKILKEYPKKTEEKNLRNLDLISLDDTIKDTKSKQDKKKNKSNKKMAIDYGNTGNQKDTAKLIYIVDGVQMDEIQSINPDSIELVNILKDDNVVVVRTKSYIKINPTLAIKDVKGGMANTIIFIDGKELPNFVDINTIPISPEKIMSISVLKGESAKIFTNKKCDGVIWITSKNENN